MQYVVRKEKEGFESLMRRFSRKVHQSGSLADARKRQYFEKPLSKREQRAVAIRKESAKARKMRQLILNS